MTRTVLKCPQNFDELCVLEEFTRDLTDVTNINDITHLEDNGLPKTGTEVMPGMVLIGKVGSKKEARNLKKISQLEQLITSPDELRAQWQQRIYDGCLYAPKSCFGTVLAAYFETEGFKHVAVVEIESP